MELLSVNEQRQLIKACVILNKESVRDFIYNIRDQQEVMDETPDGKSTWEHPRVKAWSDACVVVEWIANKHGSLKQ